MSISPLGIPFDFCKQPDCRARLLFSFPRIALMGQTLIVDVLTSYYKSLAMKFITRPFPSQKFFKIVFTLIFFLIRSFHEISSLCVSSRKRHPSHVEASTSFME